MNLKRKINLLEKFKEKKDLIQINNKISEELKNIFKSEKLWNT